MNAIRNIIVLINRYEIHITRVIKILMKKKKKRKKKTRIKYSVYNIRRG